MAEDCFFGLPASERISVDPPLSIKRLQLKVCMKAYNVKVAEYNEKRCPHRVYRVKVDYTHGKKEKEDT